MNPPFHFGQFISERARQISEKNGHHCIHWVNQIILDDLIWLDKEKGGNRADVYRAQCHDLKVSFKPIIGNKFKVLISCCSLFLFSAEACKFHCEAAEKELQSEIESFMEGRF